MMTPELKYLTLLVLFTNVMWVPYIANVVGIRGIADALGFPENPKPLSPWAERIGRAHRNALENLVIFTPLVFVAHVLGMNNETTVTTSFVFCVARIVHFFTLTFAVPVVKSVSFMIGSACLVVLAWSILFT